VAPALFAATRTSFAFAWKLIVLVEALTQPRGIGAQIYYSFRLLQPDHMISLALLFIVVLRTTEARVRASRTKAPGLDAMSRSTRREMEDG
jgi:NitT/TauT family transport system permease protein